MPLPTEVVIHTDSGCGRGDKADGWAAVLLFGASSWMND
jgi:hypothetical protein